jgi:hypothetical protein
MLSNIIKSLLLFLVLLSKSTILFSQTLGLLKNSVDSNAGFTVFSKLGITYLIDNSGEISHTWFNASGTMHPGYLADNGDLFVVSQGIKRLDWDGNLIWQYTNLEAHHDVAIMPNGNALLLIRGFKSNIEAIEAGRNPSLINGNLEPMVIYEVDTQGSIVWEWHVWDHLIQDFDASKNNFGVVEDHPELIDINFTRNFSVDWLHGNAINYNAELDQILVSPRFNSEIWIIDHSTSTANAAGHSGGNANKGGDLLYRWGNPIAYRAGSIIDQKLFGSHDAQWIAPGLPGAGHIIVYNNGGTSYGRDRNYSSIDEIIPPLNGFNYDKTIGQPYAPVSATWTYTSDPLEDFYSSFISGVQRLSNGNTFIDEGENGRLFEITTSGHTVWEYQNPVTNNAGILTQGDTPGAAPSSALFRASRYNQEYIAAINKPLMNTGPVEQYNSQVALTLQTNIIGPIITPDEGIFTYGNGQLVTINAIQSASYEFIDWSILSGTAFIDNPNTPFTTVIINSDEAVIQANYLYDPDPLFSNGFEE